jgi:Flp pilus assembly protein TadB
MSDHELDDNGMAPPVGEEIHMPAPSILPLFNAAALALAIVSVTLTWVLVIFFGIIFLFTTIVWVADTRRDIAALPLDHSSH